jgi:hypothetical protein
MDTKNPHLAGFNGAAPTLNVVINTIAKFNLAAMDVLHHVGLRKPLLVAAYCLLRHGLRSPTGTMTATAPGPKKLFLNTCRYSLHKTISI